MCPMTGCRSSSSWTSDTDAMENRPAAGNPSGSRPSPRGLTASVFGAVALALASPVSMAMAQAAFPEAEVRFEQNATDGDVEVVFEVNGGTLGLARLTVTAPDGRTVADLSAPDASTLGIRQTVLESPEPRDPDLVMAAYPEGEYTFWGVNVVGDTLRGRATLSHELPRPTEILSPAEGAEGVPTQGLRVRWRPDPAVVTYIVVIEQEELELTVTAQLAGGVGEFAVPDDFLDPGTEYKLAVGAIADGGNRSFVEIEFTTDENQ
jgi:hypothetical protein